MLQSTWRKLRCSSTRKSKSHCPHKTTKQTSEVYKDAYVAQWIWVQNSKKNQTKKGIGWTLIVSAHFQLLGNQSATTKDYEFFMQIQRNKLNKCKITKSPPHTNHDSIKQKTLNYFPSADLFRSRSLLINIKYKMYYQTQIATTEWHWNL